MTQRLTGLNILVAGAGGIGDVLARRYFDDGACVILGDIRGDHAIRVAAEIDPSGVRVIGVELDGADEKSIAAAIGLIKTQFGKLNGVHINYTSSERAGIGINLPIEEFDTMVRVNIRGFFLFTQLAVPALIEAAGGAIVYTSSVAAYTGSPDRVTYQMCKSAIHALMRSVATTYGSKGIRANAIAPGVIRHPGLEAKIPAAILDATIAHTPISTRAGQPEDIAALGSFLLSNDSGYITGQVIAADGGLTMRP